MVNNHKQAASEEATIPRAAAGTPVTITQRGTTIPTKVSYMESDGGLKRRLNSSCSRRAAAPE